MKLAKPRISPDLLKRRPVGGAFSELIGPFLEEVSRNIGGEGDYYLEHMGDGSALLMRELKRADDFTEDKRRSRFTVRFVYGERGIGKSSFFRAIGPHQGYPERIILIDFNDSDRYNKYLRTDPGRFCALVAGKIEEQIPPSFEETYNDRLRTIITSKLKSTATGPSEWAGFISKCRAQAKTFQDENPEMDGYFFLTASAAAMSSMLSRPVWLIFDNIDWYSKKLQKTLGDVAYNIVNRAESYTSLFHCEYSIRVFVTFRPETIVSAMGKTHNADRIPFPEPDIISILNKHLEGAIQCAAIQYSKDNTPFPVEINSCLYESWFDVGKRIKDRLEQAISDIETRKSGLASWHTSIANNNVRRLLKHWKYMLIYSESLWDGIFQEVQPFFDINKYKRAFINGGYAIFPGNDRFTTHSDASDGSLVVNIFDNPALQKAPHERIVRNYFATVRIMQYLNLLHEPVQGSVLLNDLSEFFDEDIMTETIKWLIWSHLINETEIGVANLEEYDHWHDIVFSYSKVKLVKNATTSAYLHRLLFDYSYISSIAISSFLNARYTSGTSITGAPNIAARLEHTMAFLTTLYEILLLNIRQYKHDGSYALFNRIIREHGCEQRPWRSMADGTLDAIKNIEEWMKRMQIQDRRIKNCAITLREMIDHCGKHLERELESNK